MVQISTSTVVVAVLAASALAAPAYDAEDMSLSRREPLGRPSLSGVRASISNKVGQLKGAVKGLRKNENKEKNRLAKDVATGNFRDARKAEKAIGYDKAQIAADKSKERTLETAQADLSRREFDDFEYELVRRVDPPKVAPKPKKTKAQRKAARKSAIDNAVNKEQKVLSGKEQADKQALRGERKGLISAIESGNFAAVQQDEAAIKKTKADLGTVRKNEATLQQIEKTYGRREYDEYELEAREFDDFEAELVRRVDPPKVAPKPKKTKAQRKAARKSAIDNAVNKEQKVLSGKEQADKQALRGERKGLISAIESGNFAAVQQDEAAIKKTKADLGTVRKNEATLQQIEKTYGRREFDEYELEARDFDEYELEARDFDDTYELEARDFDDYLEERGFDDYELEMLD